MPKFNSQKGFTLLESVIALTVLAVFFGAIAYILQLVLQNIGLSRVRSVALSIAETKMELIRNLPYTQVGTVGGIPQGSILPVEIVSINAQQFTITTTIIYIDDPFDGVAPSDSTNTDYKRARVEITWEGAYPSRQPVSLVTNVSPKGLETAVGGGTLAIQVYNAQGAAVNGATVTIDNQSINPPIHTQAQTDSSGTVNLPGTPACVACYQITVTKSGFSSDKTYSTTEVANPLKPYVTVIDGQTSPASFAIDTVSSITVNSVGSSESGYPFIGGVQFTLRGAKIIGYNTQDEPVYKYSYSTNTGGFTVSISSLEWDTYTLDFSNSFYNLAGSSPVQPLSVPPGNSVNTTVVAVPKTNNTLLLIVKNNLNELQASASSRLVNTTLGYDTTKYTSATGTPDFGQVFFSSLSEAEYELYVDLSGYQQASSSILISGIVQQTLTLNPIQ